MLLNTIAEKHSNSFVLLLPKARNEQNRADMFKAIALMRAVKRQPKQSTIDAVYCMMAEASMYLYGLVKKVDKDYLRRTKPLNLFLNSASDDEEAFNLDIAVEILLKAGAKEKISPLDKFI